MAGEGWQEVEGGAGEEADDDTTEGETAHEEEDTGDLNWYFLQCFLIPSN